jgi:hypothetical protein
VNDKVAYQGRATLPFGPRRTCDVCHLLDAEHPEPLGNDCYRRIVAARFPMSAVARQSFPTALQAHEAAVRGQLLQSSLGGLWKALARAS